MRSAVAPSLGFGAVLRELARTLPASQGFLAGEQSASIETLSPNGEPPRISEAVVIEGGAMRAHRVIGDATPNIDAFLDGTQTSRVVWHSAEGIPVVHGVAAAVVRQRRNRRMFTWRHSIRRALYAPRKALTADVWNSLERVGLELRDTSNDSSLASRHPFAFRDVALSAVQHDRERLEQQLAEEWCGSTEPGVLFVDGGIGGSEGVARSACTVGVVKSHRTLYATGDALRTILSLRKEERSSAFRIASNKRSPVASWYLRMRDASGRDPMFGLVRVEVAHPDRVDEARIGERANEVSRWILAESAPLALPDARWDRMVYGVRDCEEFLRAVVA